MLQELFRIPIFGGVPIYGYGLMMVVGFLAGLQLARFLARRSRIDPELFTTAAVIALASGIAGARLSHVLENWPTYSNPARSVAANLADAVNIRSGGLTFYGGFILATACCIAYAVAKRMPVRRGMDIVAPCLMVGLGFGRVGCFLNGCCEGGRCDLPAPAGVVFPYHTNPYLRHFNEGTLDPSQMPPAGAAATIEGRQVVLSRDQIAARYQQRADLVPADAPDATFQRQTILRERDEVLAKVATLHSDRVYNAQLYSTLTAFLIALLLVGYYTFPHAPGRVFALMLLVEAPSRFLLESLRAEPAFVGPAGTTGLLTWLPVNLSFSMFLSVWLFLVGAILWFGFRGPPDDMTEPNAPAGARMAVA